MADRAADARAGAPLAPPGTVSEEAPPERRAAPAAPGQDALRRAGAAEAPPGALSPVGSAGGGRPSCGSRGSAASFLPGILRRRSSGSSSCSSVGRWRASAGSGSRRASLGSGATVASDGASPRAAASRVVSQGLPRRRDSRVLSRARLQRAFTTGCDDHSPDTSPMGLPVRRVRSGEDLGGVAAAGSQSSPLWGRFQRSLSPKWRGTDDVRAARSKMSRVRSMFRFGSSPGCPDSPTSPDVDCHGADRGVLATLGKRVGFFSPARNSIHEVTPYATKYGIHPDFFDFTRRGDKRLTDQGIVEQMRRKDEGLDPLKLDDSSP
ncbi:unnamed protein product [Prorocentrum cordatum]|uniref:Uncharacterized protein n=1 Tax=Prorocentrum cordatum TaxID=2364126 RepID=A0ABN9QCQ8_9DINO|nr:unnamed protein product [Polarella glacialis]